MIEFLEKLFYGYPALRRVIVTSRTGHSYRGILWRKMRSYLVLRDAEITDDKDRLIPTPGEIVIERSNVEFLQVLNV